MILSRKIYLLAAICLLLNKSNAQSTHISYPQTDFRLPLDLKPTTSGAFGELRKNHFHSGLDYRTNRSEGHPVYAVADGFISRFKVQIGGFGNALYIDHPNGFTSVYAHLLRFNEPIAAIVKDCQYQEQSFAVDFPLPSAIIPVKKGDIIAWSGNTGSSGGPHLHFEVRDTKTEEIINPQLLGLTLPDRIQPEINGLYVYQINGEPFSDQTPKLFFPVVGAAGRYTLSSSSIIPVGAEVSFGVIAFDKNSTSDNKHGIYSIDLSMDGQTIYAAHWERFFFHHSRAINSYIDYPALITSGKWIQKSFVDPGNPLTVYDQLTNNGLILLNDHQIHQLKYTIKDVAGNTSILSFKVRHSPTFAQTKKPTNTSLSFFKCKQPNAFSTDEVKISLPPTALYNDLYFTYSSSQRPTGDLSKMHHIHNKLTPLNDTISLWIKPSSILPINLQAKALLVNSQRVAQGGTYENGYIKASIKTLGSFYVTVDTIAPTIIPITISNGKLMRDIPRIVFKIADNLSGIKTFTGTIDHEWILMEFDPKTGTLWHTFDNRISTGKHLFQLTVADNKSNQKIYQATFFR